MNRTYALVLLAVGMFTPAARAATLQGHVLDWQGAAAGAAVLVELRIGNRVEERQTLQADAQGAYKFAALRAGSYTVRAELKPFGEATAGPFALRKKESKIVDLVLKPMVDSIAFSDQPKYTVAGVTDHTYVGGHGSDAVKRSAEEVTKATAALSKQPVAVSESSRRTEKALRAMLDSEPANFEANDRLGKLLLAEGRYREALVYLEKASQLNSSQADLHRFMADADESLNKPLEAVREYERAAKLDPSEANLFDWGTELLVHQALQPAIDVFNKGVQLFPRSSRMLLGAAAALYARGEYSLAAERFFKATDLDPADPVPYMFLGKLQSSEITGSAAFFERMSRFVALQPQNAWANYYCAMSLWAQRKNVNDTRVQSLLEEAVRLDSGLGVGYLQLGILYAARQQFPTAIRSYQKAIEIDPSLEQAHYRLAEVYRQMGEAQKAREEDALFRQLAQSSAEQIARERAELQRFVIKLKSPDSH